MQRAQFEATFMMSALTGDGVADFKSWLAAQMAPGPWLYPADQMSDAPCGNWRPRSRARNCSSGCTRNCPIMSTVETEQWKELRDGAVRIEQTIYVERESQRKIVLGKGGQTIKAIGEAARREIAEIVEAQGALVSVREGARGLGRRPRALPGDGAGVSEGVT